MHTLFGYDDLADAPSPMPAAPRLSLPGGREAAIERILELNPSASADFLGQFSTEQLALYAEHLTASRGPRGRDAVWTRRGDTPAIVARSSAA
ncbi:MAG: hypothetical protein AAGF47_00020 [Planctomycetota bacterium]